MMKSFFQEHFGINVLRLSELDGYDNTNQLVEAKEGKFVFKTYPSSQETEELVLAENSVLIELGGENTPFPVPFCDGSFSKTLKIGNELKICRLLSYLEGNFLGNTIPNIKVAESLGEFIAKLDHQLKNLKPLAYRARKWEWDLQHFELNRRYIKDIKNPTDRKIVSYFFQQFELKVSPYLASLRKALIHNDANEFNVLVQHNTVTGIIDFGDMAYAPLINEVAVAITYLIYDKNDPLNWAKIFLKAYHKNYPLQEKEIAVLYYLIAARLCISVCNSAHARLAQPENSYVFVSEENAWKTLHHWIKVSPLGAENCFREAIGMSPKRAKPALEDLLKARSTYFAKNLSISYAKPLHIIGGAFQYMYDAEGNTILDAYNNIPCVGHAHPDINDVMFQSMAKINTNTRYIYPELTEYAIKLLKTFPKSLNKVFFVNSGSAASDLAIRLAKAHTKREKIVVMEHGYHGNTQIGIDISDYKFSNPKGQGQKESILKAPIPSTYNGKYNDDPLAGNKYAEDLITYLDIYKNDIAAFIAEPIVGCGGQVQLAPNYLKNVYPTIRNWGALCISDEVQTGFGRTGDYFWAFEEHDVVPDIVVLGKPIANGHPMGAVVCTEEVADSFAEAVEFFSSFGGNPVSCSIGIAVLQTIENEGLQQNAKIVGDHFIERLKELQVSHPEIGDVRGSGLFLGIEIVNPKDNSPDTVLAAKIKNELRNRHILVSTDGPYDNVIKSKPPMCFSKENVDIVIENLIEILNYYAPISPSSTPSL